MSEKVQNVHSQIQYEYEYIHSSEELEHEDAQGPIVSGQVMSFVKDDFGGHIFRCAAESPCLPPKTDLLGESKVTLSKSILKITLYVYKKKDSDRIM